jgi:RNA polymerase sigma-70 factor (ECF subfamily)
MADPEYTLIKAVADGDQEAFERLVKRYQNPLCNFVFRYLGDRAAAEDITQEVFMRVYRYASRFIPQARVSTWVFKIARNLSLDEIKRRQRLYVDEAAIGHQRQYADQTSSAAAARIDFEQDIIHALSELPENQRAALLLRVNEGLSYEEIGEALGLSVPSVESLIFRARHDGRMNLNDGVRLCK